MCVREWKCSVEHVRHASEEEEFDSSKAEQVKSVIDDCQRLLIPDLGDIVGTWGLIDSDPVTGNYVSNGRAT